MPKTTGANYTGNVLETFVRNRLNERGYQLVDRAKFWPLQYMEQPVYTRKYHIGTSIYETDLYCDFILYHPQKWPKSLAIEAKWQQVGGSVDEKYPFLVLNIKYRYNIPTVLILDGGGYKKGAEKWIRNQVGDNLLHVFNMAQFQTWANRGGI